MAELRIPWAYRTSEQNERQAVRFQRISFQLCATLSEKKAMMLQKRFPRGTRHFMRSIVVIADHICLSICGKAQDRPREECAGTS